MSASGAEKGRPNRGAKSCPVCGKPSTETSYPFCSERCRDVDLNRWLSNGYVIPGQRLEEEDD